jgi:zinc protease
MKAALLVVLVACGAKAIPPTTPAPPHVNVERATLPPVSEREIEGVRVVVVENHRLPLVSLAVVSTAAGGRAAWKMPGLAAVCADSIAKSTREIVVDTTVATEYAALEVTTQTDDAVRIAGELATAIRKPLRAADVYEAIRRAYQSHIASRTGPRSSAGRLLDRMLFAGHPYEVSAEGTPNTIENITPELVHAFWKTAYAPGTVTLVIVGDVDGKRVDAIAHEFASFAGPPPTPTAPPLAAYEPKLTVVDMPGATTSIVLVGTRSDPSGAPTQLAGDLANLMLGGGPDARLDKTLHDKLEVTLGAGSSYWRGRLAGSWSVAATFPTERTVEGLRATLDEIENAKRAPATDLAHAKDTLLRALATSFETTVGATRALERMVGQGLNADWYATYVRRLDAVTPADVQAAARKWTDLSIVIVGDWQKLRDPLSSFGLPVTMYEP